MVGAIFLSAVSSEFGDLRSRLHPLLDPVTHVLTQQTFVQTTCDTLEKLDQYIQDCALTLHFVGVRQGAMPSNSDIESFLRYEPGFAAWCQRFGRDPSTCSYTQWEALLSLYRNKALLVYQLVSAGSPDDRQATHLHWLVERGRHPTRFQAWDDLLGHLFADIWHAFHVDDKRCFLVEGVEFVRAGKLCVSRLPFRAARLPWEPEVRDGLALLDWVEQQRRGGFRFRLPSPEEAKSILASSSVGIVPELLEFCWHQETQRGSTLDRYGALREIRNLLTLLKLGDEVGWRLVLQQADGRDAFLSSSRG